MQRSLSILAIAAGAFLSLSPAVSFTNPQPAPANNQADSQTQTFVGEITRNPDNNRWWDYVIYDQNTHRNYIINDDSKVQDYVNKEVQITGTLDKKYDFIYVQSVKPATP